MRRNIMYHSKTFENDHCATIEKAKQWAAKNLTVKWNWSLMVDPADGKVKCVIEW